MAPDYCNPESVHEIISEKAWDFMGEVRTRSNLHDPVFKSGNQVYYLETCIWNLVIMVAAATYHARRAFSEMERVLGYLGLPQDIEQLREESDFDDIMSTLLDSLRKDRKSTDPIERLPGARLWKVRTSIDSGPVLFEFNAFLVSLRSALDYVARALSVYFRGADFHSIHRLYKSSKKNHPQADVTQFVSTEWDQWIGLLKAYRDAVTHNVVLNLSASREQTFRHAETSNGKTESPVSDEFLGFYIYRAPPKFRYRIFGMDDNLDQELPIMEASVSLEVELPDGTKTSVRKTIKRVDSTLVVPLEQYLSETLQDMQRFVTQTFALLEARKGQFFALNAGQVTVGGAIADSAPTPEND